MQYTVVHSTDPYLLARLATDLQMEGKKVDEYYQFAHPFDEEPPMSWCAINHPFRIKNSIAFFNHSCNHYPTRHELTSRNYIKVLTQILEP